MFNSRGSLWVGSIGTEHGHTQDKSGTHFGSNVEMSKLLSHIVWTLVLIASQFGTVSAADQSEKVGPTVADFAYGSDPRQRLDFWQAKSDTPTPIVVMIHGGGW